MCLNGKEVFLKLSKSVATYTSVFKLVIFIIQYTYPRQKRGCNLFIAYHLLCFLLIIIERSICNNILIIS